MIILQLEVCYIRTPVTIIDHLRFSELKIMLILTNKLMWMLSAIRHMGQGQPVSELSIQEYMARRGYFLGANREIAKLGIHLGSLYRTSDGLQLFNEIAELVSTTPVLLQGSSSSANFPTWTLTRGQYSLGELKQALGNIYSDNQRSQLANRRSCIRCGMRLKRPSNTRRPLKIRDT